MNLAQIILVSGLRVYRTLVSPLLSAMFGPMGLGCRFSPTCSCYAIEAVRIHGAMRGSWLAVCRVGRCHPWGGQGDDPVPPSKAENFVPSPASHRNSLGTVHETASDYSHSPLLKRDAETIRTTPQLISSLHGS